MNLQPTLENDSVMLVPLHHNDFEQLFAVASDPLVWEQHPNKDRYKRGVFQTFFQGAMESKGAFRIIEKKQAKPPGAQDSMIIIPGQDLFSLAIPSMRGSSGDLN